MQRKTRSSHRSTKSFPRIFVNHTTYSSRIYVSRNGICLERLGSFSLQGKLLVISLNYTRIIFWLTKGIRVDSSCFFERHNPKTRSLFPFERFITTLQDDVSI